MQIKIIGFFFLMIVAAFQAQATVERRAAFDIGSGNIKMLIADVDTDTNQLLDYIYADSYKVLFSASLASNPDGIFSEQVIDQAKKAFAVLLQRAEIYHPQSYVGIATEAFRTAKNGQQVAETLSCHFSFPIRIIPQSEEGELGFESAVAHSKGDPENAVVWDIGSGSFQISWKELNKIHSYTGRLGKVPTKNLILSIQGKPITETSSPNPISQAEAEQAQLMLIQKFPVIPETLQKKLSHPNTLVYGIGAIHHPNVATSTGLSIYTPETIQKLLQERFGLTDKNFGDFLVAQYWVSDLVFVNSLMSYLGINQVLDVQSFDPAGIPVSGNTVGILIRPSYWLK